MIRSRFLNRLAAVALLTAAAVPSAARAQDRPTTRQLFVSPDLPSDQAMDLLRAERLLHRGENEAALSAYRALWDKGVRDVRVARGLCQCLLNLSRFDELAAFAGQEGDDARWGIPVRIAQGEGLARQDQLEEAASVWRKAAQSAKGDDRAAVYEEIANLELHHGMVGPLLEIVKRARDVSGDPSALAAVAAEARETAGDLPGATHELVVLLTASPLSRYQAERKLYSLFGEAPALRDSVITDLEAYLAKHPQRSDLRETLVNFYVDAGRCDDALREAIRREEESPSRGTYLLAFAEGAHQAGCSDQAAAAFRYIRDHHPGGAVSAGVEMGLAQVLEDSGQLQEAADAYLRVADSRKGAPDGATALGRAADLLMQAKQPERALAVFQRLAAQYPERPEGTEAPFRAIDALIALGRMDEAHARADSLLNATALGPLEERARYSRAVVLFLSEDLDGAVEELNTVVSDFPAGRTVNDCLDLLMLLDHREQAPEDVLRFARAERLVRQGKMNEAEEEYAAVAGGTGPLWAQAERRRADLLHQQGDVREAIAGLQRVADKADDAVLRARSLQDIGDFAWHDLGDSAMAREAYERVLVEHSDTFLADQVRRSLRELHQNLP